MKDYTVSEIIETFHREHYDLYTKMKSTEHGYNGTELNPFHQEGDIWTHTCMVMKEAEDLPAVFKLAALCHDLGKPFVYEDNHENKRRRFSSHEAVSTFYAREVLRSFDLDYSETKRILAIVAQHGSLYNFFEEGRIPKKFWHRIVDRFDWDTFADLTKFYRCDHLGRFTSKEKGSGVGEDLQGILELMEIQHNYELSTRKTKIIDGVINVLIGAPRSGKSNWVEANQYNEIIISRDNLVLMYGKGETYSEKWKSLDPDQQKEIDALLLKQFQEALKLKMNIIVDMTNMSKKSRKKWLSDQRIKGYFKIATMFIEPKKVLMGRMTTEKSIPEYVIDNMQKSFVYPNLEEFDRIDMYNKDGQ